ncbi:MAG: 1-acyl-sn-glycerol-3-phosphate acyltransferase [Acidimicrobiia bacterium]
MSRSAAARTPFWFRVLKTWARSAAAVFYHPVETTGTRPRASGSPTILAANHSNALGDVALVVAKMPRFPRFLAASSWWNRRSARILFRAGGVLPVHRASEGNGTAGNEATFRDCHAALALGEHVVIFPEGEMGAGAELLPVKTGAARLGLSAAAAGVDGVVIVPVGLAYEQRGRFRSSAEVHFGEPIEMTGWADAYRADPRQAVRAVTDLLAARLAEAAVAGGKHGAYTVTRRVAAIALAARADATGRHASIAAQNALARRLAAALDSMPSARRHETLRSLEQVATAHADQLERLGFDGSQSLTAPPPVGARDVAEVIALAPAARVGAVANAPVLLGALAVGRRASGEGWQATAKGVSGSFLLPLTWATEYAVLNHRWGRRRAVSLTALGAVSGFAALRVLDRARRWRRTARTADVLRTHEAEVAERGEAAPSWA